MTRTARPNVGGNAKSTKTLPASTWSQLRPKESTTHPEKSTDAFKFGQKKNSLKNDSDRELRSEHRRVKRVLQREGARVCFHCRGEGHVVSECPQVRNATDHGAGVCFRCGSTEHALAACRAKVADGQLPFAKCFVCGEMGHLSKSCPDNPRGLYPMGGSCDNCGSVEHFKKDCPETKMPSTGADDITLHTLDASTKVDEELAFAAPPAQMKTAKKFNVVKF